MSGEWKESESLLIYKDPRSQNSNKIAAFDFDCTLAIPRSCKKRIKNSADVEPFYNSKEIVNFFYFQGYKIVIISNQSGLSKDSKMTYKDSNGNQIETTKIKDMKARFEVIFKHLNVPLNCYIAKKKDYNRKPCVGTWDLIERSNNIKINKGESFYCGDAAGRKYDNGKKDFSCSDRKFAYNLNIGFFTPEVLFMKEKDNVWEWGGIDPKEHVNNTSTEIYLDDIQKMVIMVGYPASGKSTFAKNLNYTYVNRDTLKTKVKCLKVAKQAIEDGQSVVIDNTNPTIADRAEYIKLAKDIDVVCCHIDMSMELAQHLDKYRSCTQKTKQIPDVVYYTYRKRFEEPTKREGYSKIYKINTSLKGMGEEFMYRY
jgi:bifunctional polynucleotide phosphatase/kinase